MVSCSAVSLPNFLPLPAYSLQGEQGRVGKRGTLVTVQALFSNIQNTGVLSTLVWSEIQDTAPYGLLLRKLTPSQLYPVQPVQ